MSIEKESLKSVEEEKEPITEREKEIEKGALLSALEAGERRWKESSVEEIKDDIETEEEISEESRDKEMPVKRSQIKEVRESRREMVRLEAEYDKYKTLTGQIGKIFKKEEKSKIKEDYDQAKDKYNKAQNELLKFYLEKAQSKWAGEKGKAKFEKFRDEVIFRRAFSREQERISQAKQEVLSKQDKGRSRKILGYIGREFSKIPKGRRWVYTALLGTGAALGTGAIAAPAALGYAGFRFGRAALASFSAVGIKGIGDKLEKLWLKDQGKEKREEKVKESLAEQMEKVNDFEQMSKLLVKKREERDEELAKLAKAQKYWQVGKVAAMIGAGGGIAFCAGHFDMFGSEAEAAETHEQLGVSKDGKVIEAPKSAGMTKEEYMAKVEAGAPKVQERVADLEAEARAEAITPKVQERVADLEAEARAAKISPESAKAEPFEIAEKVDIKRGDSIWSVAEKYLKGNTVYREIIEIGDKDMAEALETYNIDRVKDAIVANPQAYGLPAGVNLDKLTIGQLKGIDWEKAFADTFPEGKSLTDGLTQEQVDSIVENNKTLRTFFQEHPDAPRTSENYESVLKGKGITGEVEEEVVSKISPDEKKALLKEAGVSSEDIAELETEDVEALTSEQIKDIAEIQEKIDSLEKAGVSREDIAKLETEDIEALTSKQINMAEVEAAKAAALEIQINKARVNLIVEYKMTQGEAKAISGEKIGNLLKIPKNWTEAAQGDYAKIKHDGAFTSGEYKKYWQLANDLREVGIKPGEENMTVGEFLGREFKDVKLKELLSRGEAKKGAINIEL